MNNVSEEWDVEQHKTEHECDEHWELRRKFLLTHKDKFPEDELICLAQVFTNIELLGCRYPQETMELIAELAKDVVKEYREKQKTKIQRTFVKASDAASSKVKGLDAPTSKSTNITSSTNSQAYNSESANIKHSKNVKLSPSLEVQEPPFKRIKSKEPPFGDIVLVERPGDLPQSILANAMNASGINLEWKFTTVNNGCKCTVLVDSKQLAEAQDTNQKTAKKEASLMALSELRKYYYTIKMKQIVLETPNVTTTSMLGKDNTVEESTLEKDDTVKESIPDDNVGKKLMKLMGWSGGGLGKSQQGITEPVVVNQKVDRKGLGLQANSGNELKNRCKQKLTEFLKGDMKHDLIFSKDFTKQERAIIHKVARQLGLKSHRYGPKDQGTLVVSRKIDIHELVEELKSLGGVTDKYELIKPTSRSQMQ